MQTMKDTPSAADISILRRLAAEVAEIAELPVHQRKRELWTKNNDLTPVRPMVSIDQICWNEFHDPDLHCQCTDGLCRGFEWYFRETLYRWKHFPADMVVGRGVGVWKAVNYPFNLGLTFVQDIAVSDPTNGVVGHLYHNLFETEADIEKIQIPDITYDEATTMQNHEKVSKVLAGIMDVGLVGVDPGYLAPWDLIAQSMGVQTALFAMVDRPDYIHKILTRITKAYHYMLDQVEEMNLLGGPQSMVHCAGAYTNDLPKPGYDPAKPRLKDQWTCGMAQMLSTVSPAMFKEFEVDYVAPLGARFGLYYYGCCDPLDGKIDEVRQIPNVRKISMSTWVDQENGARQLKGDFVFSRKPNPAFLAFDRFDEKLVRDDLVATREICRAHGCPLEFILKDISTVRREPQRLSRWAHIAMEVAEQ